MLLQATFCNVLDSHCLKTSALDILKQAWKLLFNYEWKQLYDGSGVMIDSITAKIGEHGLHSTNILRFFTNVHRRLILQVLQKRYMNSNLILSVKVWVSYFIDFLDYVTVLR